MNSRFLNKSPLTGLWAKVKSGTKEPLDPARKRIPFCLISFEALMDGELLSITAATRWIAIQHHLHGIDYP